MARLYLWAALSCLLAPVTVLSCLNAWALVTTGRPLPPLALLGGGGGGDEPGGKWQARLLCLLAAALLKAQHSLLARLRLALRARTLGCGDAAVYPDADPLLLGIGWFRESVAAARAGTFFELARVRFERHGRTHWNRALGGGWMLVTDEPENVKAILASRFNDWEIAGPRRLAVIRQLGPRSVFTSNGPLWQHARASIRPAFVRDQIADFARLDPHVGNLLAALRSAAGAGAGEGGGGGGGGGGGVVELQALFAMMTMDSSTDFMLGHSTRLLERGTPPGAAAFLDAFDYCSLRGAERARLGVLTRFVPDARFEAGIKTIRAYVREYVADAMAAREEKEKGEKKEKKKQVVGSGEDGDQQQDGEKKSYIFLHELLDSGADEEFILDQVLSIILAGRDTTAAGLSGIFHYLARDPGAVRKLRAEMEGLGIENPTWEELRGMKYLQNVIREALRLFPPVPTNSRDTVRDTVLPRGGGPDGKLPIFVPKGTPCRYFLHTMHRRKDIFGPDADEFRPERWEDLRVSWEYLPFSGGPRICIGQQFALTQMSYVVFRIMQNFESLEPVDSGPLLIDVSLISLMKNGCRIKMTPVRDAK
ncbi:hypothetical protein RB601_000769 [Gaeumannomyces tritici]